MINLFNLLDDYLIEKIYNIVWLYNINTIVNELKQVMPIINYGKGGIYFIIN